MAPRRPPPHFPKIRRIDGTLTQNPKLVLQEFQSFTGTYTETRMLLTNQTLTVLSTISPFQLYHMNTETYWTRKLQSVLAAIKQALRGKAPGPAGFTTLYYKKFAHILASPPKAIQNCGPINMVSNRKRITLIPKPNKDHHQ